MHIIISRATTKKINQNDIFKNKFFNINIYLIQNKALKKLQRNKKDEANWQSILKWRMYIQQYKLTKKAEIVRLDEESRLSYMIFSKCTPWIQKLQIS